MQRIQLIDNLRGLAIILMLLQHIPLFLVENLNTISYSLAVLLSRFSAPLFFLLAGYCTYLSFNKNGPGRVIKRAVEIFVYGIITNIFRHHSILTVNVLMSISAFILICTIILYIRSKYAYGIILIGLLVYSFMIPEIVSTSSMQYISDIVKTGEYPIAPWLIYSVIGLGIAWIAKMKRPILIPSLSILSIIFGFSLMALDYYKLSFMHNTPPFLFMMLGLIGLIYKLIQTLKSDVLGTFGKNSLFIYVSHLFLFSFVPVVIGFNIPLGLITAFVIYALTLAISYYLLKEG